MAYGKRGGVNPRRAQQMRGRSSRRQGTFRGGIGGPVGGTAGQVSPATQQPVQQSCPTGQKSVQNPMTGEMECVPDNSRVRRAGMGGKRRPAPTSVNKPPTY